jgi:hypothetical protein
MTKQLVSSGTAKKVLASIWFGSGGVLFLVIFLQTLLGHYGEKVGDAWSWFLPTIMPTGSLIIGVLVSDAFGKSEPRKTVNRFTFNLSLILTIVYLIAVSLVIFLGPLVNVSPLDLMKSSNLGLGPLQGLVSACLGIFFIGKEKS